MAKIRRRQPSLPIKFVIGALMAGASYIMMGIIGNIYGSAHSQSTGLSFHILFVSLVNCAYLLLVTVRQLN